MAGMRLSGICGICILVAAAAVRADVNDAPILKYCAQRQFAGMIAAIMMVNGERRGRSSGSGYKYE